MFSNLCYHLLISTLFKKNVMDSYKFNMIQGKFKKEDALEILTKIIDVKVKFHEDKIRLSDNEEDIKMRENRIKDLQRHLYEARIYISKKGNMAEIEGFIKIQ
jgi:hypothetical protein